MAYRIAGLSWRVSSRAGPMTVSGAGAGCRMPSQPEKNEKVHACRANSGAPPSSSLCCYSCFAKTRKEQNVAGEVLSWLVDVHVAQHHWRPCPCYLQAMVSLFRLETASHCQRLFAPRRARRRCVSAIDGARSEAASRAVSSLKIPCYGKFKYEDL